MADAPLLPDDASTQAPEPTEPETATRILPATSWSRILIEGVVIVSSILLAFGIDAAWEARKKAHQREALLAAVASDMVHAQAEVERVLGYHRRALEAAGHLLSVDAFREEEGELVDSLVALTWASAASYDAPLAAIESVSSAGGLDLLSNPELALELVAFPADVADLEREQVSLQRYSDDLFTYLGAQGVDASRQPSWVDFPWDSGPTDAIDLVEDPRFRSLVGIVWIKYRVTTWGLEELGESVARIDSLLAIP